MLQDMGVYIEKQVLASDHIQNQHLRGKRNGWIVCKPPGPERERQSRDVSDIFCIEENYKNIPCQDFLFQPRQGGKQNCRPGAAVICSRNGPLS